MKELIESLTRYSIEKTGNPYVRFILKRNSEGQMIKAFKKLTFELFLHIPGKNIRCITVQSIDNVAGIDEDRMWKKVETLFYEQLIRWIAEGKMEETLNGVQME